MIEQFPCPKCNRTLTRSGEVEIEDTAFPIFQCDECIVQTAMFGEPVEAALTFAVDYEGTPFDPAAEDGQLRF